MVEETTPIGFIGLDINERNVTASATNGWHRRFDELGEVVEIKARYREKRARIGRLARKDHRIGTRLLAKCGQRERHRTTQRIHKISRNLADYASENGFAIKMENLRGIRRLYGRANQHGPSYRVRMNTWAFGEIQRQVAYKARLVGVSVHFVSPRGTSRNCPDCGSRVVPLADRKLYCPECDKTWDRDDLASKNIMACVVPQVRPSKGSGEGERGDDGSNPRSRWREGRIGYGGLPRHQNLTC